MSDNSKPTGAVLKNMQDGRYELYCPICKISVVPELPCPMDKFLAIMDQFNEEHDHAGGNGREGR